MVRLGLSGIIGGTYEGRSVGRNPGDEDDLAPRESKLGSDSKRITDIPLALTTREFVLNVVDSIARGRVTLVIAGITELITEGFVVLFWGDVVEDDFLLVVGDLEDDELGLAVAHAELIECSEAFIPNRNSKYRIRQRCARSACIVRRRGEGVRWDGAGIGL